MTLTHPASWNIGSAIFCLTLPRGVQSETSLSHTTATWNIRFGDNLTHSATWKSTPKQDMSVEECSRVDMV